VVDAVGVGGVGRLQAEMRRRINNKKDLICLRGGCWRAGMIDKAPRLEST
jgi:hypothetical protein